MAPRLAVGDDFGYWFSGFFDGEGCFYFHNTVRGKTTIGLKIKIAVRRDDKTVIDYIRGQLGCGRAFLNEYRDDTYKSHKPWVDFRVQRLEDLAEAIVPLFERYPLHTKKAEEFARWKNLVELRYSARGAAISPQLKEAFERDLQWVRQRRKGEDRNPETDHAKIAVVGREIAKRKATPLTAPEKT